MIVVRRKLLIVGATLIAAFCVRAAEAEILIGMTGPMTGKNAWFGEQMERATDLAVTDLNAAGGVLGQRVRLVTADDFCDPEQAVAAAKKLVSDGVIFVVGHYCSHAAYTYAAVQVWAQAAEKTGSLELPAMIAALREHRFETVLGAIDFDEKGDVTTQTPIWHVWRGGTYVPLE